MARVVTAGELGGCTAALIVGHPGHELRAWGFMQATRPVVGVFTDGGGHGGRPRLHLTRAVCEAAGATISSWFGATTDREVYRAILARDTAFFLAAADQVAAVLIDHRIQCVVADASEGYNPTHDLCRLVVDRAVRLASPDGLIENFSFALDADPTFSDDGPGAWRLDLDPAAVQAKIEAARHYSREAGGTLVREVDEMLARFGEQAFARESYLPVVPWSETSFSGMSTPFYESYGERQVAAGKYDFVIRLREHLVPIAEALSA
jgi:hypothetical protein